MPEPPTPGDNGTLCDATNACMRGLGESLENFPGMMMKIITTEAWKTRRLCNGKVATLTRFRDFITSKPFEGWGCDPDKIEALLTDEPNTLVAWREAMKQKPGTRSDLVDNINEVQTSKGTSKAYTLSRLKREAPELFEQVCEGDLSANAAAIQAGFRKKPTAAEQCERAFRKVPASDRLNLLEKLKSL